MREELTVIGKFFIKFNGISTEWLIFRFLNLILNVCFMC